MPRPTRTPADWRKIQAAYQRGEGSCRVLAERFGVTVRGIQCRCQREGWRVKKAQIRERVAQKVEKSAVETLAAEASEWVRETVRRARRYRADVDASRDQTATDPSGRPVVDAQALLSLAKVDAQADDLARRSFGLPDRPQTVDVTSGGERLGVVCIPALGADPDGGK